MAISTIDSTGLSIGGIARNNMYTGAVLQVAQSVYTAATTTTSTTPVSIVSVNITPSSATNKILILANIGFEISADLGHGYGFIQRNSTTIFQGDAASTRPTATWGENNISGNGVISFSMAYLDSPATTSSTTYSIAVRSSSGTTVYVNRSVRDSDSTTYDPRTPSSIIVMEVAA